MGQSLYLSVGFLKFCPFSKKWQFSPNSDDKVPRSLQQRDREEIEDCEKLGNKDGYKDKVLCFLLTFIIIK